MHRLKNPVIVLSVAGTLDMLLALVLMVVGRRWPGPPGGHENYSGFVFTGIVCVLLVAVVLLRRRRAQP